MRKKYIQRRLAFLLALLTAFLLAGCGSTEPAADPTGPSGDSEEQQLLSPGQQKTAGYMQQQAAADLAIKMEMSGDYTLDSPFVMVNPYGLSPLSAVIGFHTREDTSVRILIKGKEDGGDISHCFEKIGKDHLIPVYGLYADYENTVELTAVSSDGTEERVEVKLRTEALPEDISLVDVKTAVPEKMAYGLTFFDCPHINGNYFLALDGAGEIRWYFSDKSYNGSVMLTHLQNGNMLIGSGEIIEGSYNNLSRVYEITPLGKFVKEYQVYGIHHDIRELSSGDLLFAASREGAESQNDYIVQIDRNTGKKVRDWDLMEIIPMTAYDTKPPYKGGISNWLHNNAVWYIEQEDAFVISGRHQNMVMKFDASTHEIRWILSATVGEDNEKLRPYLLKPVTENGQEFEYPTSQHAAMQTPEGDLLVFDNRNFEEQNEDGSLDQSRLYSRAVRYEIDEKNMTVKQVWQYGRERGTEIFSSFVSDVDYLGENHYLIDFGGQYKLADGSSYDHVLTPKDIKNTASKETTVIEILEDEVIFEARLYGGKTSNTYKAERKDIYRNAEELSL